METLLERSDVVERAKKVLEPLLWALDAEVQVEQRSKIERSLLSMEEVQAVEPPFEQHLEPNSRTELGILLFARLLLLPLLRTLLFKL